MAKVYPSASISTQRAAIVSAIGRDLKGLRVMLRGLTALDDAGIVPNSALETGRGVDVQFVLRKEDLDAAIKALHHELIETGAKKQLRAAA